MLKMAKYCESLQNHCRPKSIAVVGRHRCLSQRRHSLRWLLITSIAVLAASPFIFARVNSFEFIHRAAQFVLNPLLEKYFDHPAITEPNAPPVIACSRLQPPQTPVHTLLWRISRPRRLDQHTWQPDSYIFGTSIAESYDVAGRFSRADPNWPFTSRPAKRAFEQADVFVNALPTGQPHAPVVCDAPLPYNRTIAFALRGDQTHLEDKLDGLWKTITSSVFKHHEFLTVAWREQTPAWFAWAVNIMRIRDLRHQQILNPHSNKRGRFIDVNVYNWMVTNAIDMNKEMQMRLTSEKEECDELLRDDVPINKEVDVALLTSMFNFYTLGPASLPYEAWSKWENETFSRYLCGNLTHEYLAEQCKNEVTSFVAGAPLASIENVVTARCYRDFADRNAKVSSRVNSLIQHQSNKSFFILTSAYQLLQPAKGTQDTSIVAALKQIGYEVDEVLLPQNSPNKFLY